jgi:hypothetical protein
MAAHQSGKGFLPTNREPLEFFQKLSIEQRGGSHRLFYAADTCAVAALISALRMVSGV